MLTPPLLNLTRVYQRELAAAGARTGAVVSRAFLAITPLDDASAAAWLAQVRPLVDAGRLAGAGLADAYLSTYGGIVGDPLLIPDQGYDLADYRQGVTPDDVYMRSVIKARTIISEGNTFQQAMELAAKSALARADTDVMLAARKRTGDVLQANNVQGYRRVPDANACAFCLLVSTQRYHVRTLMPIHTRCHCTVAPIYGTHDPGRVIQTKTFEQITKGKAANVGTTKELGPVVLAA